MWSWTLMKIYPKGGYMYYGTLSILLFFSFFIYAQIQASNVHISKKLYQSTSIIFAWNPKLVNSTFMFLSQICEVTSQSLHKSSLALNSQQDWIGVKENIPNYMARIFSNMVGLRRRPSPKTNLWTISTPCEGGNNFFYQHSNSNMSLGMSNLVMLEQSIVPKL